MIIGGNWSEDWKREGKMEAAAEESGLGKRWTIPTNSLTVPRTPTVREECQAIAAAGERPNL